MQDSVRYEIEDGMITIAYGYDKKSGVFMGVQDKRLKYDENESAEVNRITEKIGTGEGDGDYLDIFSGKDGVGTKVSNETMRVYLKRYGVPDEKIETLFSDKK